MQGGPGRPLIFSTAHTHTAVSTRQQQRGTCAHCYGRGTFAPWPKLALFQKWKIGGKSGLAKRGSSNSFNLRCFKPNVVVLLTYYDQILEAHPTSKEGGKPVPEYLQNMHWDNLRKVITHRLVHSRSGQRTQNWLQNGSQIISQIHPQN